jgi:hypothetical protein|tara:strand:- start:329 stop:526 length:198 start_codon:yes stop_codon:yes gene_type:complete
VYYGAGFTHDDVYSMPTYLRRFYFKKLSETKKKEVKEIEKSRETMSNNIKQANISKSKPVSRFKR